MNELRKKLKNNPVIKRLASLKITVVCLSLLFILVFWGTVAQVENGLYQAQERYFHSCFFLIFNLIPFPGAQGVLWILFVNLICVALTRFVYNLEHLGISIIHIGLLTYFVAAFVTFHVVEESQVTLMEGDATNVSTSYHDWEISVWPEEKDGKRVTAYDAKYLERGMKLSFSEMGFIAVPEYYYPNSQPRAEADVNISTNIINASGIRSLTRINKNKEPEKNFPGLVFQIVPKEGKRVSVLLYGGESRSTQFASGKQKINFMLRKKRLPLPFLLKLKKFTMEVHPGTEIARSYQSLVEIEHDGLSREVLIYMNNPLRYKNYTLYQASYSIDAMGRKLSTLAVVHNQGRLLPYISAFITFLGLVTHFLMRAFMSRGKHV